MISAERIRNLSPQQRQSLLQRLCASDDSGSERQIVAYVVRRTGCAVEASDLRNSLRSRLPDFMVPAQFVFLPALPLMPNGKVDRQALPNPKPETIKPAPAGPGPRTETEAKLIKIWAEVLRIEHIGVQDDFFRLGGHSLLALQVMARVRDTFHADLPLKTLFEAPTIAGLAEALHRFSAQPPKTIAKIPRRGIAPKLADRNSFVPTAPLQNARPSHEI